MASGERVIVCLDVGTGGCYVSVDSSIPMAPQGSSWLKLVFHKIKAKYNAMIAEEDLLGGRGLLLGVGET